MTKEEQIAKAEEYHLSCVKRDDLKDSIITSLESKFKLGNFDIKEDKETFLIFLKRELEYLQSEHCDIHDKNIQILAAKRAKNIIRDMIDSSPGATLVWTIEDNNIQQLVNECIDKVNTEFNVNIRYYVFDAIVGTDKEFCEIVKQARSSEKNVIIVLNFLYAHGDLWNSLYGCTKHNEVENFYMIVSTPLEDGVEKKWDQTLNGYITHSVLMSD